MIPKPEEIRDASENIKLVVPGKSELDELIKRHGILTIERLPIRDLAAAYEVLTAQGEIDLFENRKTEALAKRKSPLPMQLLLGDWRETLTIREGLPVVAYLLRSQIGWVDVLRPEKDLR